MGEKATVKILYELSPFARFRQFFLETNQNTVNHDYAVQLSDELQLIAGILIITVDNLLIAEKTQYYN